MRWRIAVLVIWRISQSAGCQREPSGGVRRVGWRAVLSQVCGQSPGDCRATARNSMSIFALGLRTLRTPALQSKSFRRSARISAAPRPQVIRRKHRGESRLPVGSERRTARTTRFTSRHGRVRGGLADARNRGAITPLARSESSLARRLQELQERTQRTARVRYRW